MHLSQSQLWIVRRVGNLRSTCIIAYARWERELNAAIDLTTAVVRLLFLSSECVLAGLVWKALVPRGRNVKFAGPERFARCGGPRHIVSTRDLTLCAYSRSYVSSTRRT